MAAARELFDSARSERSKLFNRERLLAEITASGFDAVVALSVENTTYCSGSYIDHILVPTYVVTASDGAQVIVVNEADAYYMRESSWIADIRPYRFGPDSSEDAAHGLAESLRDLGVGEGRLGIELNAIAASQLELVARELPGAAVEDGSAVFGRARLVKTKDEVGLFEAAALATAKAISTGFALARPGDSEKTLQASIQSIVLHLGADQLGHAHVHAGVHSTVVHAHSLERPMVPGEVVHADFGAVFAGYRTDLARNCVIGDCTSRQAEIYRKLVDIEETLIADVRPGVRAADLYKRGVELHARAGLEYPWGTMGHGAGLSVHDGFELSRGSELELEVGMILNVEPSHIEAGDARYHIEDTLLVTERGARVLSDFGRSANMFSVP